MKENGWTSLLHFEMTGISKIENELKKEIPVWLKTSSSPYLLVILQKIEVYTHEHIHRLGYFLENEQISSITSHQNIIGILSRELHEKLKFCTQQEEKEHCIASNITAISCLKNNFYNSCQKIATRLNLFEAAIFFKSAAEDEARIWKWSVEGRQPNKEFKKKHYLLL